MKATFTGFDAMWVGSSGMPLKAAVKVKNANSMAGDEVVGLYLAPPDVPTNPRARRRRNSLEQDRLDRRLIHQIVVERLAELVDLSANVGNVLSGREGLDEHRHVERRRRSLDLIQERVCLGQRAHEVLRVGGRRPS